MSWNDFDLICSLQNEQVQKSVENEAISAVHAAVANSGQGLRDAVSAAIQVGLTTDDNWKTVVSAIQCNPGALATESDSAFYRGCPKPLLEELVAGEKGVFSFLLDRINGKTAVLDNFDFRIMHIVFDCLIRLGQLDRLRKVANMFAAICETRTEGGILPGSFRKKLNDHGIQPKNEVARPTGVAKPAAPKHATMKPHVIDTDPKPEPVPDEVVNGQTFTDPNWKGDGRMAAALQGFKPNGAPPSVH